MKSFVKHLAQCLEDKRRSRNVHYHYLLKIDTRFATIPPFPGFPATTLLLLYLLPQFLCYILSLNIDFGLCFLT